MPPSPTEKVKEAARYITENKALHPQKSMHQLIDEASLRFDLTPLDTEALLHIFMENKEA